MIFEQIRLHLRTPNRDALVLGFPVAQVIRALDIATVMTNPYPNNDHCFRRKSPLPSASHFVSVDATHIHPKFQDTKVVDAVTKQVLRSSVVDGSVKLWAAVDHSTQLVELVSFVLIHRRGDLSAQQQVPQAIEPSAVVRRTPDRDWATVPAVEVHSNAIRTLQVALHRVHQLSGVINPVVVLDSGRRIGSVLSLQHLQQAAPLEPFLSTTKQNVV